MASLLGSWTPGFLALLNTSAHTASPTHTDANGHYSHLPLLFSPLSGALFPTTSHDPVLCLLLTLPPWEIHTRTREEASSAWGGWAPLVTVLPTLYRLHLNARPSLGLLGTCFSPHVPASCLLPREPSKDRDPEPS